MSEGSHLETLRFELEAKKQVLISENSIRDCYSNSYYDNLREHGKDYIQTKASYSVMMEYEDKHIPRTERMIEALEWAVAQLS